MNINQFARSLMGPIVHLEVVAWYEGYEARMQSQPRRVCPFGGHLMRPEWLDGWQLADEELRASGKYMVI